MGIERVMLLNKYGSEAFESIKAGILAYKYDYSWSNTAPKLYFIQLGYDFATIRLTDLTKRKLKERMLTIS